MRPLDDLPYIEWVTKAGATKRVYADAWRKEKISATATITEHAVETGAKVTDHYLPDRITASASMFISGSPLRGDLDPSYKGAIKDVPISRPTYPSVTPLLSPGGITQAIGGAVDGALTAIGLGSGNGPPTRATVVVFDEDPRGRLRDVYEQLLALRQSATLVTVGFSQALIENLAISSIELARSSDDGDSGTIDLEFSQMNFVSTQSAAAVPLPVEPRAKPKGDSVSVSAADATRNQKSLAKAGYDSAREGLGL